MAQELVLAEEEGVSAQLSRAPGALPQQEPSTLVLGVALPGGGGPLPDPALSPLLPSPKHCPHTHGTQDPPTLSQ